MLYIVFDIALFLLSVLVIFLYRYLDRKDRQIYLVKTYMERMKHEMEDRSIEIHSGFSQITEQVEVHEASVRSMLKRVDQSLEDLETHAADLSQLQTYIAHYHRILKDLATLTDKAETRLSSLSSDIEGLDEVKSKIASMQATKSQFEDTVRELEGSLLQLKEQKSTEVGEVIKDQLTQEMEKVMAAGQRKVSLSEKEFSQLYDNALRAFSSEVNRSIAEAQQSIQDEISVSVQTAFATIDERLKELPDLSESVVVERSVPEEVQISEPEAKVISQEVEGFEAPEEVKAQDASDEVQEVKEVLAPVTEIAEGDSFAEDLLDLLDEDMVEDAVSEIEQLIEVEVEVGEDQVLLDEVEEDEVEEDPKSTDTQEEPEETDEFDEIYYEDDEEIILDDVDDEVPDEDPEPMISPDKKSLVEEHLKEGFSIAEIAELTNIPKGEIELIKELSEFSN